MSLRTPFRTSEPEAVRNARNQLRTGAGEIARVKITPTFETLLDGPAKLMSEWMDLGGPRKRKATAEPSQQL